MPRRRGCPGEVKKLLPTSIDDALDELRRATAAEPLQALSPVRYAEAHALFEARSDQRAGIIAWLVERATALPRSPARLRVLSIGCGDGSVDAEVAHCLAQRGPVDYHGVEPHAPSAALFASRLGAVSGVDVTVERGTFPDSASASAAPYDLVIAVHSLYYVEDLAGALAEAHGRLASGGQLLVVHAPRERLNSLVGVLAPGRTQEFSEAVAACVERFGWPLATERVEATLDLGRHGLADAQWREIIDFTVQAVVPDTLVDLVERALRGAANDQAAGDAGLLLAHPVDAFIIG